MLRRILIFSVCAMAAAAIPTLYESNPELLGRFFATTPQAEEPAGGLVAAARPTPATQSLSGRKVSLQADARGHFTADFKINGRRITGLVDTGATLVAINLSTARKIGLKINSGDFKYTVDTANGKTPAAAAMIDTLQIGRIVVEDVQAIVLEDKALGGTLIGASFLNRLDKFQVDNGSLLLVQ